MDKEGDIAVNDATGERIEFRGGKWRPMPAATVASSPVAAKKSEQPLSASDVAVGAITNFPSSAWNVAKGMVQPIIAPREFAGGVADLAGNALIKYLPGAGATGEPLPQTSLVQQYAQERYGGTEPLKRTIATDPAGFLADASMLLTGGGSAARQIPQIANRTAGAISQAGETAERLGRGMDFARYAPSASTVAQTPGKAVANVLGFTTGTGGAAVGETARAGMMGGRRAEVLAAQMRGTAPAETVVDEARKGLAALRQQRSQQYTQGMAGVTRDKTVLDFRDIDKVVNDVKNRGTFKGVVFKPEAAKAWQKIDELIAQWKTQNPAEFHTPEGMDKLKQGIGEIRDSLEHGTPARNAADQIYNAVRGEIARQAPDYANVMSDYEQASKLVSELESSLSIGKKSATDTALRKLQSIFRNNANTNYGRRVELGRELEAAGATDLFPMLAGQQMSSVLPRGLQGSGSAVAGLATALTAPKTAAFLLGTSPRVVGEAAFAAGAAARPAYKLAEGLKRYGDELVRRNPNLAFAVDRAKRAAGNVDPYTARMLAFQLSQLQNQE